MSKVTYYFILSIATLLLSSCTKDDDEVVLEPIRVYSEQYATDILLIEDYLKANYITVIDNPGQTNDQDVTITKIPTGGNQASIYSYLNSATFPKLLFKTVRVHDVDYKLYYLVLREGSGVSPCSVDGVLSPYNGKYLYRSDVTTTTASEITATQFEESIYPNSYQSLYETITAWSEIFPLFKSGTYSAETDGSIAYKNFGAGVLFIPSGLAYFDSARSTIPSYSPLIFSFKLYDVKRLDQDFDGIPSYLEDRNGDGFIRNYLNTTHFPTTLDDSIRYADDTDKDGIPDFLDTDDDGDNYTTKLEIKNSATGLPYPFAQIPTCTLGKKNYLDASCHP